MWFFELLGVVEEVVLDKSIFSWEWEGGGEGVLEDEFNTVLLDLGEVRRCKLFKWELVERAATVGGKNELDWVITGGEVYNQEGEVIEVGMIEVGKRCLIGWRSDESVAII